MTHLEQVDLCDETDVCFSLDLRGIRSSHRNANKNHSLIFTKKALYVSLDDVITYTVYTLSGLAEGGRVRTRYCTILYKRL